MRYNRHYYWKKINDTPFTVVVTFPDDLQNQVRISEHEAESIIKGGKVMSLFKGNFRLHPKWIYCRSLKKSFEEMKLGEIDPEDCEMSPEEELEYFIEKFERASWKWKSPVHEKGAYKCDQKLMQALLFDAKATEKFQHEPPKKLRENFINKYNIISSFIATHSGLLRYKIYDNDEYQNRKKSKEFGDENKNAIDEDWYKHAVEFNKKDETAFIYSIPFSDTYEDSSIMTAITIFASENAQRAPIAVVGFQFPQEELVKILGEDVSNKKISIPPTYMKS